MEAEQVLETGLAQLNIVETHNQANGKQFWVNTNTIPLRDTEKHVVVGWTFLVPMKISLNANKQKKVYN